MEVKTKLRRQSLLRKEKNGEWAVEVVWVLENCSAPPSSGPIETINGKKPKTEEEIGKLLEGNGGEVRLKIGEGKKESEGTGSDSEAIDTDSEDSGESNESGTAELAIEFDMEKPSEKVRPAAPTPTLARSQAPSKKPELPKKSEPPVTPQPVRTPQPTPPPLRPQAPQPPPTPQVPQPPLRSQAPQPPPTPQVPQPPLRSQAPQPPPTPQVPQPPLRPQVPQPPLTPQVPQTSQPPRTPQPQQAPQPPRTPEPPKKPESPAMPETPKKTLPPSTPEPPKTPQPSPTPPPAQKQAKEESIEVIELNFYIDQGEPLGLTLDEKLTVTKVQAYTVSHDSIKVGDVILELNNRPVPSLSEYYRLVPRFYPHLCVKLKRVTGGQQGGVELAKREEFPQSWERHINRRAGYSFHLHGVDCEHPVKRPLGLAIDTFTNRVIVTQLTKEGSAAAAGIQILDRIVAVDGEPVSDKEVVKRMILDRGGKFQALIERPVDPTHISSLRLQVQQKLTQPIPAETDTWAAFDMPPDVQEIVKSERSRRGSQGGKVEQSAKKALRSKSSSSTGSVSIAPSHKEYDICSDIDPKKPLRKPAAI